MRETALFAEADLERPNHTRKDQGHADILDTGIQRTQYGRIFLESLPKYTLTQDIAEVRRLMQTDE